MDSNSNWITNRNVTLKKIVNKIVPNAKGLSFLVGYFHFSGAELFEASILEIPMRILVGLELRVEGDSASVVAAINEVVVAKSKRELQEEFCEGFVRVAQLTDLMEVFGARRSYRLFRNKLVNGTLEIRQTKEPNHAKLFLFSYGDHMNWQSKGEAITGSSNLSKAGFETQFEINYRSKGNPHDYEELSSLFEDLWRDSIPLLNQANYKSVFVPQIDSKVFLGARATPYELYALALMRYFNRYEFASEGLKNIESLTANKFSHYKYQSDAISQAIGMLKEHRGVLLTDVVGLGKSVIASMVAHYLKAITGEVKKVIVICRPLLKEQWEVYGEEFDFDPKIFGSNSVEKAVRKHGGKPNLLVIVDEAHAYRSENGANYQFLKELCVGNKVLLLTATPYNNNPKDLIALLRLFQLPGRATITPNGDLKTPFDRLVKKHTALEKERRRDQLPLADLKASSDELVGEIQRLIEPVLIRRNRLDLMEDAEYQRDLDRQGIKFPEVLDPESLEYDLGEVFGLYTETLRRLVDDKAYKAARYDLGRYLKPEKSLGSKELADLKTFKNKYPNVDLLKLAQSLHNVAGFIRRLVVRRYESSQFAFKETIKRLNNNAQVILNCIEKFGVVLIYKGRNLEGLRLGDDDLMQENTDEEQVSLSDYLDAQQAEELRASGSTFIPISLIKDDYVADVKRDIDVLKELLNLWNEVSVDPKFEHFKSIVAEQLRREPNRKIVVFSEFTDTVEDLEQRFKEADDADVDYRGRIIGYSAKKKPLLQTIKANFDASLPLKEQQDAYSILLATDALSEGYNLHRAGTVFNYDIPYNPTRVMQRVGRINRIARKQPFNELRLYNFFPTEHGEKVTSNKGIATLKVRIIQGIFGDDTKVLTKDEQLAPSTAVKVPKDEHEIGAFNQSYSQKEDKQKSWETDHRNCWDGIQERNPDFVERLKKLPNKIRLQRPLPKDGTKPAGSLVLFQKGNRFQFAFEGDHEGADAELISLERGFLLLAATSQEGSSQDTSASFDEVFGRLKRLVSTPASPSAPSAAPTSKRSTVKDHYLVQEFLNSCRAWDADYAKYFEFAYKSGLFDGSHMGSIRKLLKADPKASNQKTLEALKKAIPIGFLKKAFEQLEGDERLVQRLLLAEEMVAPSNPRARP